VASKRRTYAGRRMQGMLIPLMRRLPVIGRNDGLARRLARAFMFPERLVNAALVRRQDRRAP
jgi:hypothetical protein